MEMNLGEILDRMSIAMLKAERVGEETYPEFVAYTLDLLGKDRENWDVIIKSLRKLYSINDKIWKLESDLRRGKEGELGLEEVGRRAIKIRNYNSQRVKEKNRIVELYKDGFPDIKRDHASQPATSITDSRD